MRWKVTAMVKLTTLDTLARLEREMAASKRTTEEEALRDALTALVRPESGFLTTGEAAELLSICIPTVKRWIERGTLKGGEIGGGWLVTRESVDRILDIRKASADLDTEGIPTIEEIIRLRRRSRPAPDETQVA